MNENLNQCDGCVRGDPLRGDLHIDKDGHAYMGCERSKYHRDGLKPRPRNPEMDALMKAVHGSPAFSLENVAKAVDAAMNRRTPPKAS
jgi:hypothetical protein